jgi:pimeloyl-ACP methyl ester carboxylesterase
VVDRKGGSSGDSGFASLVGEIVDAISGVSDWLNDGPFVELLDRELGAGKKFIYMNDRFVSQRNNISRIVVVGLELFEPEVFVRGACTVLSVLDPSHRGIAVIDALATRLEREAENDLAEAAMVTPVSGTEGGIPEIPHVRPPADIRFQEINVTLMPIHGFWSSPATWKQLNAAWLADDGLRGLRIHEFGYGSPKKPPMPFSAMRIPDYDDIAQLLATEYATVLADASDIAIVTHSQGGLILQRFLLWMLNEGRGRELARVRTIVMLACPNGGSEYLRSLRHVLGFGRHAQAGSLEVFNRQVADTQRAVLQRIVNATGVDNHQCRIPVHVYVGGSDRIVTAASAQGAFPGASALAGNHSSILDPAAPGNRTAQAVKHHILSDCLAAKPLL